MLDASKIAPITCLGQFGLGEPPGMILGGIRPQFTPGLHGMCVCMYSTCECRQLYISIESITCEMANITSH